MKTVPILSYIPPMEYYEELKIDPVLLLDKFLGIVERVYGSLTPIGILNNNWIEFYLWLCEVLKSKEVDAAYIFGSSVYRMDNPHDITDIDIFILSSIRINVPIELKEILHVQHLGTASLTFEICGLSQQLLILKTSESGEKIIERARKTFNEEYLFYLILRDVYKVCATKRVSDLPDHELKEKIKKMKLTTKEDEISPHFVREMLRNVRSPEEKIQEGELLTLLDFSFRRRKVKEEYRKPIKEKAINFWKAGR